MHDIGRTQLEQQSFSEFGSEEYEDGEFEDSEFEGSEFEGSEFGEFGRNDGRGAATAFESPFSEIEEMELASELLEVASEQELEQFLGNVFRSAGQTARKFLRSDTARALGGILKDNLRNAAKQALPVVGRAIGGAAGGRGDLGARAGTAVGSLLGLELEGLSGEDREFEVARQLVRFAGSAARNAAAAPARMPPRAAARMAVDHAARAYAPGLAPGPQGRSANPWPQEGRWTRRGRTIVLFGS